MSLKKKLIAGAIGLVALIMLASLSFVSILVTRQNQTLAANQVRNAINVVRYDLMDKQHKLAADALQMASANKMASKILYLNDNKHDKSIHLFHAQYQSIVDAVFQVGQTSDLWEMAVYDTQGDLRVFAVREDRADTLGYVHYAGSGADNGADRSYYVATLDKGTTATRESYKQATTFPDINPAVKYEGPPITGQSVDFECSGNQMCLLAAVPIIGEVFNAEKGKMEQAQVGFVRASFRFKSEFTDKMARLTGMKINLFSKDHYLIGTLDEYQAPDLSSVRHKETPDVLADQQAFVNNLSLAGGSYIQGTLPLYHGKDFIGMLAVLLSDNVIKANSWQIIKLFGIVALVCLLLVIPVTIAFANSFINPILKIVAGLDDLADGNGDLTTRLEIRSKDEIGTLARCFNTFMDKLQAIIRNISGNASELSQSSASLSDLSHTMSDSSADMRTKSNSVNDALKLMTDNIGRITVKMDDAASNIHMVSTATEEMTGTINEIARSSENARSIAQQALQQAQSASDRLAELKNAAEEIGKVTETINQISEQTNLLALNATIESARAGEAGKGFAVVANEIKELAHQTARATHEIEGKVNDIQAMVLNSTSEMNSTLEVVDHIHTIIAQIATAVEEQSVTTREIAVNIAGAHNGVQEVNTNVSDTNAGTGKISGDMVDVDRNACDISEKSRLVEQNAEVLKQLSIQLEALVSQFRIEQS